VISYNPKTDGGDIKDLMNKACKHIKFDKKFIKQIKEFRLNWVIKDTMYAEFLGGNLLGVHSVRFSARDEAMLMNDIYGLDTAVLKNMIRSVPGMNPNWVISTDPVLITLTYSMHILTVSKLPEKYIVEGIKELYFIYAYKVFGSLLSRYFKHNVSLDVAKATYENLSNRYLIKQLGSWNAVLEYRTGDILPKRAEKYMKYKRRDMGLHYEKLVRYNTDDAIKLTNDLQGRIREFVKNIYRVMITVISDGGGVNSVSSVSKGGEGPDSTKDVTERVDKYVNRLQETVTIPVNLINDDIIYLVTKLVKFADSKVIKDCLLDISEEMSKSGAKLEILSWVVVTTISYIRSKGITSGYSDNLAEIVNYMKGYWSSGSVKDKTVVETKKYMQKLVKGNTKRKTKWYISANSTALIVYLFIIAVK